MVTEVARKTLHSWTANKYKVRFNTLGSVTPRSLLPFSFPPTPLEPQLSVHDLKRDDEHRLIVVSRGATGPSHYKTSEGFLYSRVFTASSIKPSAEFGRIAMLLMDDVLINSRFGCCVVIPS